MMGERSESIEMLAAALASAQAVIAGATKDRENPHFRCRYADLASIWDACRGPLTERGLAVTQTTRVHESGQMTLVTTLLHTSGQWLSGEILIACDYTRPQVVGSWLTYARRYALAAIAGVAPEDDDAEGASAGAPDARQESPRRREANQPDRRPETWSQWIGQRLREVNASWMREMVREGVEPDQRQEFHELTNEPRVVNHLCTRLIELGRLDAASIAKPRDPKVRDPARARNAVRDLFAQNPASTKRGVERYLAEKLTEARAQLGMPDPGEDRAGSAEATAEPSNETAGAA